jgi:eukaryotic-like serine/threonine-protein kinase
MTTEERWDRIESVFAGALEVPRHQRSGWLDDACADDAALREEVDALLAASDEATNFLSDLAKDVVGPDVKRLLRDSSPSDSSGPHHRTGDIVGHYEVLEPLGSGGMGVVYRARDLKLERTVALKFLPHDRSDVGDARQRLLNEAKAASALDHPNICTIHEIGETDDGHLFIAMAAYDGETLAERIKRGPLSIKDALDIGTQLAAALAAAHARGIVHRDLKPANVMVTPDQTAKLLDFGLAKVHDQTHTRSGFIAGTVSYMSPEQANGERVDQRTDVWSLGVIMYEMLSGARPFVGDSARSTIGVIMTRDPDPVVERRPETPGWLAATLSAALDKDPDLRPSDGAAFHAALTNKGVVPGPRRRSSVTLASIPGTARDTRVTVVDDSAPVVASPASRRKGGRPGLVIGAVALAGGAIALGAWTGAFRGTPLLEKQGWVVIADFENMTGDSVLDRPLHHAMVMGLSQSRYVNVLSAQQVAETLRWMQRADSDQLDLESAREVALRRDAALVIAPSISRIDSTYVLGFQILNPQTRDILASRSTTAEGRNNIIPALDRVTKWMRRDVGESAMNVQMRNTPLQQATTGSLEALIAWSQGNQELGRGRVDDAAALYRRAVELDPDFAIAHVELGQYYYFNANDPPEGERHFEQAMALRDRVTERERLAIEAKVAGWRGDRQSAIDAFSALLALYPNDPVTWSNLGYENMRLGRYQAAITAYERAIALDSLSAVSLLNLATSYSGLGDAEKAIPNYRAALELAPAYRRNGSINHEFGLTYIRAGDLDAAEDVYSWMAEGSTPQKSLGLRSMALLRMYTGRYHDAVRLLDQSRRLDRTGVSPATAVRNLSYLAAAQLTLGDQEGATRTLAQAVPIADSTYILPFIHATLGRLLVRTGRTAQAQRAYDVVKERGLGTGASDSAAVQVLSGDLAMARNDIDAAAAAYEQALTLLDAPSARRALANALVARGDEAGALKQLQELITQVYVGSESQEEWILAHYDLARLLEARGDTAAAIDAYDRFLTIWRDADPDLPPVVDARQRLAAASASDRAR